MTASPRPTLAAQSVPQVRMPPHRCWTLPNGVRLVIVPRRDVPLVAFCAVLRGGARGDPVGRSGVSALYAGLLSKGAGSRDSLAFAEAVEEVGGSFGASTAPDYLTVSGQFLAEHQRRMLDLLAAALLAPRWSPIELDELRARQIELIKAAKDSDPADLLGIYGRAFLFRRHAYGRPVMGSEASLASMTVGDVVSYYRRHCGADRLALVFAGDVDASWLARAAAETFGDWRRAAAALPAVPRPSNPRRRVLLIDLPGAKQSYFWIGGLGVDKRYPRRAALDLVNTLYGGRFTSLLNSALRIRSGLSYEAVSSFTRGAVPGEFAIRSHAPTDHTAQALDLALGTLSRLKSAGVSNEMLESARAYALGQHPLAFETAADWAAAFAELEAYGLTPEYLGEYETALRAVSLEDARRVVLEAFPDPDRTVIVLIADAAKVRASLARYGPVAQLPLTRPTFEAPARRGRAPRGVPRRLSRESRPRRSHRAHSRRSDSA
ncbi:MAG TPA: pitrilysin family protein [Steroidobacteraceae bacterium]|nr:pitrilysin family protein [Steroidobacteraceae bacterium]